MLISPHAARVAGALCLASGALVASAQAQFSQGCVPLQVFDGPQAGAQFGWVTERLGDLDGDGADDLGVGAPFHGGSSQGRLYVYSSATGAELFVKDSSNGANLGFDVGDAGDWNDDGVPDVLGGAPGHSGTGGAFIYSGVDGTLLQSFFGEAAGDSFGYGVACMGDLTGDGVEDYLVGAINHDTIGANAGRAYVMSGADASIYYSVDGVAAGDLFGSAVGNVGDIDKDGFDDFVVGARNAANGNPGRAYLYSGVDGTRFRTLRPATTGSVDFGWFFAGAAGDTNADGTPDVYVADVSATTGGGTSGNAFVYCGETGDQILVINGLNNAGIGPGRAVGDYNGDGYDDLFIAEWTRSQAASAGGRVRVYSGLDGSILRAWTGTVANDRLGFDAHGLGDVNGDGAMDFVITSANRSGNAGRVYIVSGGMELSAPSPGAAGEINSFAGKGAQRNSTVLQVFGFTPAQLPFGMTQIGIQWPFFLAPVTADNQGLYSLDLFVASELSGLSFLTQTVDAPLKWVSNLVEHTFL